MPIGVIIDAASVAVGGILGALAGHKLPENLKVQLNIVLGLCSMGMGISAVGLMKNMPAVIFAIVLGSGIGLAIGLGGWIDKGAEAMQRPVTRLLHSQNSSMSQEEFTATLVTVIVLFCASGTGIYGSLDAGMTGDSTILISKSILDLFTAAVFACNLGYVVSLVALPQLVIFLALFFGAKGILPMTTPDMIADFKACGGFLMVATGLRMTKIKSFPIADMIPAMVLAMPFSWLWSSCIVPLLG
ncbi:DUF554 domain-containing protein [Gemmiger formicilis]|uniref:DUF554 domain-containing protein n=1 Tax=Gemmiger formicilis TaxID=745368 RepID=UPI001957BBFC|nr:DUF554 domain-containing protein [Gemmiger formicilis]MBM6916290.1 DUF554 domain-containing protein [Gemmiger formicilis]